MCLRCGRAAPETGYASDGDAPAEIKDHRPLRSTREVDASGGCPGNPPSRAIKRNLRLAGEAATDVVQIELNDIESGTPMCDRTRAASIAVALRTATSRALGIDEREIGWAVSDEVSESEGRRMTISLFDTAGGGAGYVALVPSQLASLLRDAARILDCPRDCDRACQACLLNFDTQHIADVLDRKSARAFLSDLLLESLALPEQLRVFGPTTQLEYSDLAGAVVREMSRAATKEVRVYLDGDAKDWDRSEWPMGRSLVAFVSGGAERKARVFLPRRVISELRWDEANDWAEWSRATGVELRSYDRDGPDVGVARLAAELLGSTRVERFALLEPSSLAPGEVWGAASRSDRSTGEMKRLIGRSCRVSSAGSQRARRWRSAGTPTYPTSES